MTELIKITTNAQGSQVVSGRELHAFLEVKDNVNTWAKTQFERAMLIAEVDYTTLELPKVDNQGGLAKLDYAITLSAAKEIAMLNGGDKGKQARLYFIECERIAKASVKPKTQIELLVEMALFIQQQDNRVSTLESKVHSIEQAKEKAMEELHAIERSTEYVPEVGLRLKVNQIVREYAEKSGTAHRDVWTAMYRKMLYVYRFNVNGYKKVHSRETKLDIVERENQLDNLFALVSKELI